MTLKHPPHILRDVIAQIETQRRVTLAPSKESR
jgi:hypothetical protein